MVRSRLLRATPNRATCRFLVIIAWLALTVGGVVASFALPGLLSSSVQVPGSASARADALLEGHFRDNPDGSFTVIIPLNSFQTRNSRSVEQAIRRADQSIPGARLTQVHTANRVLYANVTTKETLEEAVTHTETLRRALRHNGLPNALVTGPPAIEHDIQPVLDTDLRLGELIGLPVLLLIIVSLVGWRLTLVPFITAGAVIYTSLLLMFILAHWFLVVAYVPNLTTLLGLGFAMDYSLFVCRRFREEGSTQQALSRAMATAGKAAILSGVVVCGCLASLFIIPVPFIQSLALTGVIVPVVASLAVSSLVPTLLSLVRVRQLTSAATPPTHRGLLLHSVVARVTSRPALSCALGLFLIAGLGLPVLSMRLTPGSLTGAPRSLQSIRAIRLISARVGAGFITPIELVIDTGHNGGGRSKRVSAAVLKLAGEVLRDRTAFIAAIGSHMPYVDPTLRYVRVTIVSRYPFGAPQTQNLVRVIRGRTLHKFESRLRVHAWVGGVPAEGVDFLDTVFAYWPVALGLTAVVMFVLLSLAFQSLTLAAIAVFLDALSALAALGAVTIAFQFGLAHWIDPSIYSPHVIEAWIPVVLVAVLLGLSMDYQVFLISRVNEARKDGMSARKAALSGIESTGSVMSGAAIIMIASMAAFVFGRIAGLQEFGLGLGLAVLIDVIVVRLILLPGFISLAGLAPLATDQSAEMEEVLPISGQDLVDVVVT